MISINADVVPARGKTSPKAAMNLHVHGKKKMSGVASLSKVRKSKKKEYRATSLSNRRLSKPSDLVDYGFSASSGTFNTISSTGTPAVNGDDVTADSIPIGFTFYYDGVPYNEVAVCTNGWLSFDSTTTSTANGYAVIAQGDTGNYDLQTDMGMRPFIAPLYMAICL